MAVQARGKWNPAHHPRDARGRFTKSATRVLKASDSKRAKAAIAGFKPVDLGPGAGAGADWVKKQKAAGAVSDDAVARYFAGDWKETHQSLRSKKDAAQDPDVIAIDKAMQPLSDDVMLERRVSLKMFAHIPMDQLQGMKVRDAAYQPTALQGSQGEAPDGMVTLHMAVPAGTRAIINPADGSIVLDRDTETAISRVEANGRGGYDLYGIVIPKQGAQKPGRPAGEPDQADVPDSDADVPSTTPDADAASLGDALGTPDSVGGSTATGGTTTPRKTAAKKTAAPAADDTAQDLSADAAPGARISRDDAAKVMFGDKPAPAKKPPAAKAARPAAGTRTPPGRRRPAPAAPAAGGKVKAADLVDGDHIRATGDDGFGAEVTRTGYQRGTPSPVQLDDRDALALSIADAPDAPGQQLYVDPDADVDRVSPGEDDDLQGALAADEAATAAAAARSADAAADHETVTGRPAPSTVADLERNDHVRIGGRDTSRVYAPRTSVTGYVSTPHPVGEKTFVTISEWPDGQGARTVLQVDPADPVYPAGPPIDPNVVLWRRADNGRAVLSASQTDVVRGKVIRDPQREQRVRDRIAELSGRPGPGEVGPQADAVQPPAGSRLAAMSPVDRAALGVAVEDAGPGIFQSPLAGGSFGDVGRYVGEGPAARPLVDKYGADTVWGAAEEWARANPAVLARTPDEVNARRADRARLAGERSSAAAAAMKAGDYSAARAEIDAGEAVDPAHLENLRSWDEMRAIVARVEVKQAAADKAMRDVSAKLSADQRGRVYDSPADTTGRPKPAPADSPDAPAGEPVFTDADLAAARAAGAGADRPELGDPVTAQLDANDAVIAGLKAGPGVPGKAPDGFVPREQRPAYRKDYLRGWQASTRNTPGALEAADLRGESEAWYHGWEDVSVDNPKFTSAREADADEIDVANGDTRYVLRAYQVNADGDETNAEPTRNLRGLASLNRALTGDRPADKVADPFPDGTTDARGRVEVGGFVYEWGPSDGQGNILPEGTTRDDTASVDAPAVTADPVPAGDSPLGEDLNTPPPGRLDRTDPAVAEPTRDRWEDHGSPVTGLFFGDGSNPKKRGEQATFTVEGRGKSRVIMVRGTDPDSDLLRRQDYTDRMWIAPVDAPDPNTPAPTAGDDGTGTGTAVPDAPAPPRITPASTTMGTMPAPERVAELLANPTVTPGRRAGEERRTYDPELSKPRVVQSLEVDGEPVAIVQLAQIRQSKASDKPTLEYSGIFYAVDSDQEFQQIHLTHYTAGGPGGKGVAGQLVPGESNATAVPGGEFRNMHLASGQTAASALNGARRKIAQQRAYEKYAPTARESIGVHSQADFNALSPTAPIRPGDLVALTSFSKVRTGVAYSVTGNKVEALVATPSNPDNVVTARAQLGVGVRRLDAPAPTSTPETVPDTTAGTSLPETPEPAPVNRMARDFAGMATAMGVSGKADTTPNPSDSRPTRLGGFGNRPAPTNPTGPKRRPETAAQFRARSEAQAAAVLQGESTLSIIDRAQRTNLGGDNTSPTPAATAARTGNPFEVMPRNTLALEDDVFGNTNVFEPASRSTLGIADRADVGRTRGQQAVQQLGMFAADDPKGVEGQTALLDALMQMPEAPAPAAVPLAPDAPEPTRVDVPDDLSGWSDEQLSGLFVDVTALDSLDEQADQDMNRIIGEWARREQEMNDLLARVPDDLASLPDADAMSLYADVTSHHGTMNTDVVARLEADLDRRDREAAGWQAKRDLVAVDPAAHTTEDDLAEAISAAADLDDWDSYDRLVVELDRRDREASTAREAVERDRLEVERREAAAAAEQATATAAAAAVQTEQDNAEATLAGLESRLARPTPTGGGPAVEDTAVGIENRIRDAYDRLTNGQSGWVGLADVRDEIGDADRVTVDGVLRIIMRMPGVQVEEETNQKALTQRDRAAAVVIGSRDQHAIKISPDSPRGTTAGPVPTTPGSGLPANDVELRIRRAHRALSRTGNPVTVDAVAKELDGVPAWEIQDVLDLMSRVDDPDTRDLAKSISPSVGAGTAPDSTEFDQLDMAALSREIMSRKFAPDPLVRAYADRAADEYNRRKAVELRAQETAAAARTRRRLLSVDVTQLTDAELADFPALLDAVPAGEREQLRTGRGAEVLAEATARQNRAEAQAARKAAGPTQPPRYTNPLQRLADVQHRAQAGMGYADWFEARRRLSTAEARAYGLPGDLPSGNDVARARRDDPRDPAAQATAVLGWYRHLAEFEQIDPSAPDWMRGFPDDPDVPDVIEPIPAANLRNADRVLQAMLSQAAKDRDAGDESGLIRYRRALARAYRIPYDPDDTSDQALQDLAIKTSDARRADPRTDKQQASANLAEWQRLATEDGVDPTDELRSGPSTGGKSKTAAGRKSNPVQEAQINALVAQGSTWLDAYAQVHRIDPDVLRRQETDRLIRDNATGGKSLTQAYRQHYDEMVYDAHDRAETATAGHMLNDEGKKLLQAGRLTSLDLFSGPSSRAYKYASEELKRWWGANPPPRMTFGQWRETVQGDPAGMRAAIQAQKGNEFA